MVDLTYKLPSLLTESLKKLDFKLEYQGNILTNLKNKKYRSTTESKIRFTGYFIKATSKQCV